MNRFLSISLLVSYVFLCSVLVCESPPSPSSCRIPVYSCTVVRSYPHDRNAFTQGLVFEKGFFYEGTGIHRQSELRKTALETGSVLQSRKLPDEFFGEGITIYGNKIIQLTWQSHTGFVYDKESFELTDTFRYPTEGWGITCHSQQLIMSDGSSSLYFLNPETYKTEGQITVHDADGPVTRLNELEYIRGEIYANIWQSNRIARIDPQTGRVTAWIELENLLSFEDCRYPVDVPNGIAYNAEKDRLFVTGKLWPKIFEIRLVQK